VIKKPRKRGG